MRELQNLDGGKQVQKNRKGKSSETGSSKGTVSVSYSVFFALCLLFLLLPVIILCLLKAFDRIRACSRFFRDGSHHRIRLHEIA